MMMKREENKAVFQWLKRLWVYTGTAVTVMHQTLNTSALSDVKPPVWVKTKQVMDDCYSRGN